MERENIARAESPYVEDQHAAAAACPAANEAVTMIDLPRRAWLARLVAAVSLSPFVVWREAAGQERARKVIDVRIVGRRVVEPERAIRAVRGDEVEMRWLSDEPVRLHLHGYDVELDLRPGEPAAMVVRARATGRFPITSHGWGRQGHGHHALTYLEVHPR